MFIFPNQKSLDAKYESINGQSVLYCARLLNSILLYGSTSVHSMECKNKKLFKHDLEWSFQINREANNKKKIAFASTQNELKIEPLCPIQL